MESLIEISEEQEDDEEDASAAMPALPMIAEAAHILEPFLPIEKLQLPGVCQTQGFRVCGDNIDKTIHRRFLRSDVGNIHCKKKSVQCTPNMVCYVCPNWNTLYGVKSHHILGVCLTPNWVCFHTNSVCFPTNFSVFSHSL